MKLPGRRKQRIAVVAVAALAVVLLLWSLMPERVEATSVVRRDVAQTLVLTGRVRPPARPQLGATIAGTVREVLVREGDQVSSGQLLVRLDASQAAADVAGARAALAEMRADARADVGKAARELAQANRDLARARMLHEAGALSLRDREEAAQRAADARADWEAASARAASGGSTATADVARIQAQVEAAEARLALTRIVAPAAGIVIARRVEPGDAVMPGQVLVELALRGPTEIVALASEETLSELQVGAAAVASADAYPDRTFPARISWVAPAIDPAQGTIEVRLDVPAPPAYLLPDMTVSVNVEAARRPAALVIPRDAVRDLDGDSAWVLVLRDGRAVRRAVTLGVVTDAGAEVRAGLAEGDLVLPSGVEPGARVRVSR